MERLRRSVKREGDFTYVMYRCTEQDYAVGFRTPETTNDWTREMWESLNGVAVSGLAAYLRLKREVER